MDTEQNLSFSTKPWWADPWRWLVVAGPMIVVVAGLITMGFAIHGADTVVDENYYQRGLEKSQAQTLDSSLMPAKQARNHAAAPMTNK